MTDADDLPRKERPWRFLPYERFDELLDEIRAAGFRTIGPKFDEGAVVLGELASADQLPRGWLDEQEAGSYRLRRDERAGWFDFVVGPQSLKPFLLPPRETLYQLDRSATGGWHVTQPVESSRPLAVIGVRGCDLAALAILDRVFLHGEFVDPRYARRRESLLLVGISCRRAAMTCFCHFMETGPQIRGGCDIELCEINGGFLLHAATVAGAARTDPLQLDHATAQQVEERDAGERRLRQELAKRTARPSGPGSGRWIDRTALRDRLFDRLHDRRWEVTAERCLACANCTMVCPTCFCTTIEEVADLHNEHIVRQRRWESCFTTEHSYTVAGPVHPTIASRYRQWMVHKLAAWEDQFGTTGCVGCGRCITWCPVGIDLTEEVAGFQEASSNE